MYHVSSLFYYKTYNYSKHIIYKRPAITSYAFNITKVEVITLP